MWYNADMVIPLIRIFSLSPQGPNEPLYYYYMSTLFIDPEREGSLGKIVAVMGQKGDVIIITLLKRMKEEKKKVLSL